MNKRRWLWLLVALLSLVVGPYVWWYGISPVFEPHPGRGDPAMRSTNLRRDLKLMWETRWLGWTGDPTHGPNSRASTDRAINAGSRVFNTVELVGMTREEVTALLGDPKHSSTSIYNFPFWPAPEGSLVYRFDSGAYGWQFNLLFDAEGRVAEVQRRWIH